jgi:hypothetical protein
LAVATRVAQRSQFRPPCFCCRTNLPRLLEPAPIQRTHGKSWNETKRGLYLRKFALLMSVCALLAFATFAHSQQLDLTVGGGTLISTKNSTASQTYLPPPEKGGTYATVSIDRIYENRFGFSAEGSWRVKQTLYNYFQQYRPVLYDFNAVFAPRLGKKTSGILMAGVGGQSVLFYSPYGGCFYPSGCVTHLNSNHFLMHVGGGINYTVWRHIFVRPEAHYYRIVNNTDVFHSDNVLRVGVSVGYTFHRE